jgi:hypothetical protein
MASLTDLPELIGFFSYSRDDDDDSHGTLSELRDRIQRELRGQLGRSRGTFRLWQDKEAIAPGKLWEGEIKTAIEQSAFFIPIVTPTAVRSQFCKHEFDTFLARESALGRDDLVFPIYYIRVPALENEAIWRSDPVLSIIGQRQWTDWRELRLLDVRDTRVREAVAQFCAKVADTLQRHVASPEEKHRQAETDRLAAEAAAARKAEEAEARRQAELARQRAEAERRQRAADAKRRAEEEEKKDEKRTAPSPAAIEPATTSLLDALWPASEGKLIRRDMTFVALGAAAFTIGELIVSLAFLVGAFGILVPALSALYVAILVYAFWPERVSSPAYRHVTAAALGVIALGIELTLGYFRISPLAQLLLPTTVLLVGAVAAGNLRLAVPLVLLCVLAFVAINNSMTAGALAAWSSALLAQGVAICAFVAVGWRWPPWRVLVAALAISIAFGIWLIQYGGWYAPPVIAIAILAAFTVVAVIKLGWQFALKLAKA